MLYRTEFTYGAKIVERGMKVLDAINTQKETEKQGLKRKVLINEKNRNTRIRTKLRVARTPFPQKNFTSQPTEA